MVKCVKEKGAASTLNSFTTRVSSTSLPGTGMVVSTCTVGSRLRLSTGATPLFWNKKKRKSKKETKIKKKNVKAEKKVGGSPPQPVSDRKKKNQSQNPRHYSVN